jgi:hypothetical protein
MAFILSRNAKLFVSTVVPAQTSTDVSTALGEVTALLDDTNTWQIPVMDGFSFSQGVATQEVQISEAGPAPARGQRVYNTALEPVNWSFSNYMRPRYDPTATGFEVGDAVERIMWEAHAAPALNNTVATNVDGLATTRVDTGDLMTVDYDASNTNNLLTLSLFFKLDETWYWIRDSVVDVAEIDFSIESIATITWNGFGNEIRRVDPTADTTALADLNTVAGDPTSTYAAIGTGSYLAAPSDTACIRNKLSTLYLEDRSDGDQPYTVPITGGSVSISNNITYLTPEALGVLNRPCAHFTGARTVSGNITAYLNTEANYSADLMGKLQSAITGGTDPEKFNFNLYLGNNDTLKPSIQLAIPYAHLVVPVINLEDVISVDIAFNGLPFDPAASPTPTWDLNKTNEIVVTYHAAQ